MALYSSSLIWARIKRKLTGIEPNNAWLAALPKDKNGYWQHKTPISYNVIDPFGQHFLVWFFPKAGGIIEPHTHTFDHASILQYGTVVITGDSERPDGTICTAPDVFKFKAGVAHSIKALKKDTICIHTYPPGFLVEDIH